MTENENALRCCRGTANSGSETPADLDARAREIAAGLAPEEWAERMVALARACKLDEPTDEMIVLAHVVQWDGRGELLALATEEWPETDETGRMILEPHGLVDVRGRITAKGRILARMLAKWRFAASQHPRNPWRFHRARRCSGCDDGSFPPRDSEECSECGRSFGVSDGRAVARVLAEGK